MKSGSGFPLQADAFRGHGFNLLVHFVPCGAFSSRCSRWSRRLPLQSYLATLNSLKAH